MLTTGDIDLSPPCPAFGEADVRRGEVREQAQIALGLSQRMNCSVCFVRGQERQAYFAVEGLPAHLKAGSSLPGVCLENSCCVWGCLQKEGAVCPG